MLYVFVLSLWLTVWLLPSPGNAFPKQINYTIGHEYYYNLTAHIDARGHVVNSKATTYGTTSLMTSTVAIKCLKLYTNTSWLLVMNMFNTRVGVGQGSDRSNIEMQSLFGPSSSRDDVDVANSHPLGEDMYFEHAFDGSVPTVWHYTHDSPVLVQMKSSAINAYQTHIVPENDSQVVSFADPAGKYEALVSGTNGGVQTLSLTKEFDAKSFYHFSDPSVKSENVAVNGLTTTLVHPSGVISGSQVKQSVVMTNMKKFASESSTSSTSTTTTNSDSNSDKSEVGFNSNFGSNGALTIILMSSTSGVRNGIYFKTITTTTELTLTQSTLFDIASSMIATMNQGDEEELKNAIIDAMEGRTSRAYRAIEIIRSMSMDTGIGIALLSRISESLAPMSLQQRDTALLIASQVGGVEGSSYIISMLVRSDGDAEVVRHAILSSCHVVDPTGLLLDALWGIFETSNNDNLRRLAVLAYGSLLSRFDDGVRESELKRLMSRLEGALEGSVDEHLAGILLLALANSDLSILPSDLHSKIIRSTIPSVRHLLSSSPSAPYPYNKDITKDWKIGGSVISATLDAELFAGTNFDCNHTDFNFKLLAQLRGTAHIFGINKDFLLARAVYGQVHGQALDNELLLQVFGKTIYQKPIPGLDCIGHKYSLFHTAPGTSLSYTLWIAIIPVRFSLHVGVVLQAEWDWRVCTRDLSLELELVPMASLTLSGDVNLNLLIVRGGVSIETSLGPAEVIPKGQIIGSLCEVRFDVDLDIPKPIDARFYAYYQFRKCKFLIFDCHWEKEHEHTFWEYSHPAEQKSLYSKVWKIAK